MHNLLEIDDIEILAERIGNYITVWVNRRSVCIMRFRVPLSDAPVRIDIPEQRDE